MAFGALRGVDLNHRPLGYEPNELPGCSTPRIDHNKPSQPRSNRQHKTIIMMMMDSMVMLIPVA